MGKNYIFLVMLLISSFSFGQIINDQGFIVSYQGARKIRSEKSSEKCDNVILDVYRASAILKNNSNKKISNYSASINFNGKGCEWYEGHYSIDSHLYSISFISVGTKYVDGCNVALMPGDEVVSYCEVYVLQGQDCPEPTRGWYNFNFCGDAPKQAEPTSTQTAPKLKPQWSVWQAFSGTDCNPNIEFQTLKEGGYVGLQYQLWLHYRVKNNNNKTVKLQFSCLDANGKVHFGNIHTINPGQIVEDMHKMDSDKIKSYRPDNLVFATTGKSVCEQESKQLSLQTNTQNVVQGSSQSVNQSDSQNNIMALISKKNNLCEGFYNLLNGSGVNNQVYNELCAGNQSNYSLNDQPRLNREITQLESAIGLTNRQIEGKKKGEEEKQRMVQEQQKKFDDLITQGDSSYSSKSYDYAMGYYTQAKNIAVNDSQKQLADQKYNQAFEGKKTVERKERLEAQNIRDKNEDLAYTSLAAGAVTAMSLFKDQYVHKGFALKFQTGIGYEQTPMITNQNNPYAAAVSYEDKASYPLVHFGLNFEFANNKAINLNIRPLVSIGMDAFSTGMSGTHVVTGVDGGLRLWYKSHTKFKLFADFGWYERVGDKTADKDAQSGGITTTDEVREGKYSYHVLRYGAGPMLHWRHDGRESWIKPGVYFDQLTFAKDEKPTMLFGLSVNIKSQIIFEASYGKDYPVAGTLSYPGAFVPAEQNYFSIKIIRQGKL